MVVILLLGMVLLATVTASQYSAPSSPSSKSSNISCSDAPSRLNLVDGPHDNYFYSDCHSSTHVIVTSPRSGDDVNFIRPRLLVAWPAGNSGALAIFAPANGKAGTLAMSVEKNSSTSEAFESIYELDAGDVPRVGVKGNINFNDSAILAVPVLGSVRAIRDYTEGSGVDQAFQNSFGFAEYSDGSASINRTWFDGVTTTTIKLTPLNSASKVVIHRDAAWTLQFGAGTYRYEASFNYPQLEQLSPQQVLTEDAAGLIAQEKDLTTSLAFLSYSDKLLAGTWRFLTYFGRDSMISMLLMQSILSPEAIEAVIGAVLERINREDGTVCHEEVLGDYATYLNRREGITSSKPRCDYKMVDTDFLLPIAMQRYFLDTQPGKDASDAFFKRTATFLAENEGLSYAKLAQITAEKIMRNTAAFVESQTKENLIHLRDGEGVGQWRDSGNGLGGGRTPYDVNTALAPAGLRAIAALSRAGFFPDHSDWKDTAERYAQVWEDETLQFFEVTVSEAEAKSRVQSYVSDLNLPIPAQANEIVGDVKFYGLAVDGSFNGGNALPVMNTDDCFRHFFLNTTNQTQLSAYLDQTAEHILKPFPVGLATDVGLVVANPAYANDAGYARGFSQRDYHGTVVWSFQLAMMAAGLGRQLGRCDGSEQPDFCTNTQLHSKVLTAYSSLWDTLEANRAQLSHEVWSWAYNDDKFQAVPLGAVTSTESNIRQLWSLTFLAVHREKFGAS
ncbi:hypothetical protein IQ06DRAFT_294810 [Phaeosphaeriaceae sp. SRC1lsM3a]|nr:hypothetical protein IQ06DRAFT_294810 [Stagonospora sp. SRC1lsM3a]